MALRARAPALRAMQVTLVPTARPQMRALCPLTQARMAVTVSFTASTGALLVAVRARAHAIV